MKKKLTSLILAAAMVLAMPTALFAAEAQTADSIVDINAGGNDIGIAPMAIDSTTVGASRTSSTSASVTAYASFDKTVSKATCTIILQEKSGSSWKTATGLPVTSYSKTVYNEHSIMVGKIFTVKSGKVYRAKVIFSEPSSIKTKYTGSF